MRQLRRVRPCVTRQFTLLSVLVALGQLLIAGRAHAQFAPVWPSDADEPAAEAKVGKVLRAFRITGSTPQIDGRLNEEVWAVADAIDDLVQVEPDNMVQPTERTMVQVAYDDRYLYVAARSYDREPSEIVTGLGRRDTRPRTDRICLSLDPRHDHLTAYIFEANASGVQNDFTFFDDTRTNSDYSGVWEVATQVTEEGWMAEFQIPFSQMRFDVPPGDEVVWGFQVRRDIYRRGETDRWVGLPRGERGFVSRFGHLVFGDRLSPPRRVELLPFAFTRQEDLAAASPEHSVDAGLDLRLGLGTSATLSATLNPDFGQVEQDPAVLNLTVFESFFPERRPFFLEDSGAFQLPYPQLPLFHSRRIGRRPGRLPLEPGDRLVERPDQTTILGATKVTSRGSTWSYGAMTALTDREYATVDAVTVDDAGTETVTRAQRLIEPLTFYNVARVQRNILGGTSNVGAIATAVVREGDADAVTGGIDYNFRWGQNLFQLDGHWVGTRAPFADGLRTGFGGVTRFFYFGKYVGVDAHLDHFSPNFRNTDLGFKSGRVDKTDANGVFFLRQPDPWGIFRFVQVGMGGGRIWNGDGLVLGRFVNVGANMQFRNFWRINLFTGHDFRVLDDLDTRGGPPIVNVFGATDSRKTWQVFLRLNGGRDEEGGWHASIGPELELHSAPGFPECQLPRWVGRRSVDHQRGRDW